MIDQFSGRYGFLSNFYPHPVEYEGKSYLTVEHAFQAAKTLDPQEREMIAACTTPGKAKRAGRKVTLRDGWNEYRLVVMRQLLLQKFGGSPRLRQQLFETGDHELVERNHWGDRFWGVCMGEGANHLGRLLMEVRHTLRKLGEIPT